MKSFYEILGEGVDYLSDYGYDGMLDEWIIRLRESITFRSEKETNAIIKRSLSATFDRSLKTSAKRHPAVSRITINKIKPELRNELTKRIRASADLIRLNRAESIDSTLRRFSGWASSVPAGGTDVESRRKIKAHISKPLKEQRFIERRVAIDQGHKLISNADAVIADQAGAIAAKWRSHWRQAGYDYRVDHKDRDKQVYALRNSWAKDSGLINAGAGYIDAMTMPAEEVYCRCYYVYLYNLRELPNSMLTKKGAVALEGLSRASA